MSYLFLIQFGCEKLILNKILPGFFVSAHVVHVLNEGWIQRISVSKTSEDVPDEFPVFGFLFEFFVFVVSFSVRVQVFSPRTTIPIGLKKSVLLKWE